MDEKKTFELDNTGVKTDFGYEVGLQFSDRNTGKQLWWQMILIDASSFIS